MMTKNEGVLLASRAFALYLVCWGLSDITYLPQYLLSYRHHSSVLIATDYWSTYHALAFWFHIVRIVALLAAAGRLYHCGERVQRFFLPIEQAGSAPDN
jgi:hypothetical protein